MGSLAGEDSRDELTSLDLVIRETVKTLENGREHLFAIAENARHEYTRMSRTLQEINEQLAAAREELEAERYHQLEQKQRELETSRLNLRETAEKAENMVSQVGVVMDFIKGNLRNLNLKLENLQQRQQAGLQVIKAQEEERKRVAREIHDGPAQSMANVVLRVEFCEKLLDLNPEKIRDELRELKGIVRNNLQDVRKIIFNLRPMTVDDLGIVPALRRYIEDFRQKNDIYIEMNVYGRETRLEPVIEIALFRLIQEALNNVVKHARASKVNVTVEIKPDWVKAGVEDDGVGFDVERYLAGRPADSFGLISMKERTDLLGGEMNLDSKPGEGTRLTFKVPVI